MMCRFLVVFLPLTPSNCAVAATKTTGYITIAKFQSVKIDTNETTYQRVVLKVYIKFYSPTLFTNSNIAPTLHNWINMKQAGH